MVGLKQSLALDPIADLEIELQEPLDEKELARIYGLDLQKLLMLQQDDEDGPETRPAIHKLEVLSGIDEHLETSSKQIHREGNIFQVEIAQLPCRISSQWKSRLETLPHTNHKFKHDFTDVGVGFMYRCPLPGCGGAALNQASVRRALLPHRRAYHHTNALRFAFHIDAKRGREVFLFPPVTEQINQQTDSQGPKGAGSDDLATHDMDLTPFSQDALETPPNDA